jgi:D-beta-D-heptose 7-phosphate kinase/D-beta-D-heptose 1-phosphate adenosyltransferase
MHENIVKELTNDKIPNILVIGDFIHDEYVIGTSKRINPEAPVPIVEVQETFSKLGGAGNVVMNLRSLGANVTAFGTIGQDSSGEFVFDHLNKLLGEDQTILYEVEDKITPRKTRVVVGSQQIVRFDNEKNTEPQLDMRIDMINSIKSLLEKNTYDCVIISDYDKGVVNGSIASKYIEICQKAKVPVYVDPKANFSWYRGATMVKPNKKEAMDFLHRDCSNEEETERALNEMIDDYGLDFAMITLSSKGIAVKESGEEMVIIQPHKANVADVCGAGDVCLSAFTYAKAKGLSVVDSAYVANLAASISCNHIGTYAVRLAELLEELNPCCDKIVQPEFLKRFKGSNETIVFSNGCFDLLHPGHIEMLKFAKSKGDVLIVAVNTDESVRKQKGENRPHVNQVDRMKSLAALECVDYVTYFDDPTPESLMKTFKPDVYVLGDDHKDDATDKWAKETVFFKRFGGYSTTGLTRF